MIDRDAAPHVAVSGDTVEMTAEAATRLIGAVVLAVLLGPTVGLVSVQVAWQRGFGCEVVGGYSECAEGKAYGFLALVVATAVGLGILAIHAGYEGWRGEERDVRAVATAVTVTGALVLAVIGLALLALGAAIVAVPVLFAAWVLFMLDRERDVLAIPLMLGAAVCCARLATAEYLFVPFCGALAWVCLTGGLLRLRACRLRRVAAG